MLKTKLLLCVLCVCSMLLAAHVSPATGQDILSEDIPASDALNEAASDTAYNTVKINGAEYSLEERILYDGAVSLALPKEFSILPEESAEKKYYSQHLPDYMFANEKGSIAFTFDALDMEMRTDEVFYSTLGFRSVIYKLNPKNNFISLDSLSLGGTELGYFDYIVPTSDDKKAYCMFYITPLGSQILFGTFTCPADEYEEWKPVIFEIFDTVSTENSCAEPKRGPLTDFWPITGDDNGNYEFRLLRGEVSVTLPVDAQQPQNLFPVCDVPTSLASVIYSRNPYIYERPEDDEEDEDDVKAEYLPAPASRTDKLPALFFERSTTVRRGESLWDIALREYGDGWQYAFIYENNREAIGEDPSLISEGQVLKLPSLENTEISIAGEEYKFERRELFDGKISMVIPADFTDMPEYFVRKKYTHYTDSQDGFVRVCNEDVNICFLFDIDDEPFSNEEVYSYILDVNENWERNKPSFTLFTPDTVTLEDGTRLAYFDYITPSLDGDIFNVIFVMPVEGTGLMGWFSCNTFKSEDWKLYAHEALRTIRYEGKNNPPSINAEEYYNLAMEYYDSGRSTAALSEIDKAIRLDSENALYYSDRGVIYMEQGALKEALSDFERSIELDPSDYYVYYNRAIVDINMDDYLTAIKNLDKAIELNPEHSLSYHNRARSYWKLEEYEQALEDWNESIRLEPDNAIYIQSRGVAYENAGFYEEAEADYNRAVEIDPDDADYRYQRANYYSHMRMYAKAILEYTKAIELDPAVNYACQHNRALAYHHIKVYDKAIEDYTDALNYHNKDPNTYNNRAIVYYDMKMYDKAISDLTTAICLGSDSPNCGDFYRVRSLVYEEIGEYEKSRLDYEEYSELRQIESSQNEQSVNL